MSNWQIVIYAWLRCPISSRYGISFHVWRVICGATSRVIPWSVVRRSCGPPAHVHFLRTKLPRLSHTAFSWKQDLRISSMPSLLGIMFFILRGAFGSLVSATCHRPTCPCGIYSTWKFISASSRMILLLRWPAFCVMSKLSLMLLYLNGTGVHGGFPLRSRAFGRSYLEIILSFN